MSSQSIYEKIEAYLEGNLTIEERELFEKELKTDSELSEKFALYKKVDKVIADQPTLAFQKMVEEQGALFLQKELSPNESPKAKMRFLSRRNLLLVASLLFILVSSVIVFRNINQRKLSGPELFAQNFTTYDLNKSLRSEGTGITSLKNGIKAYQSNDYEQAATFFEALLQETPDDMLFSFCLAQAYLNQGEVKYPAAKKAFEDIINDGGSIYVPKAKWYLALILLKENAIEEAKSLLQDVSESGDQFGAKAKEILKQI